MKRIIKRILGRSEAGSEPKQVYLPLSQDGRLQRQADISISTELHNRELMIQLEDGLRRRIRYINNS